MPNRSFVFGRLGFTLVLAFVILAIVPSTILVLVTIGESNDQALRQATNQLESVTEIKSQQIQSWLGKATDILTLVKDNSREYALMVSVFRQYSYAVSGVTEYLDARLASQDTFTEFFVYSVDGTIEASTDRGQVSRVVTLAPYFEASLTGEHIQPPYYEVRTNQLNMVITQPILNVQGQQVGVIAGRLDLNELSGIMTTNVGLGETGETYLVSLENNYLVTNSRFDGYPLNRAYHSEGIDAALAGTAGSGFYSSYRGTDVAGVYRWLPEIQLGMVSELEQSEALQAGDRLGHINRIVGFLIALVAGAAGIGVAIWITRPIEALTHTASLIAQGDYGQRVPVRRNNEIGQLAETFNQMTDQLQATFTNLEENIQQLENTQKENVRLIRELRDSLVFKDQFLATMSHELRTPLNAIIGYTGIAMIQGGLPEKADHMLGRVKINSNRLLNLINDILDISRINAGGVELVRRPVNMRGMVNGWFEDLQRQQEGMGKNHIRFLVDFDENLPEAITGDEERISQIAINLLTNAFKFTDEGTIALAVKRGTMTWSMSIRDTGQGIPETWQHLIFDEFRQVDGTSKRKHGGTGLGLSIVKKLCLLMGGTVTVNSKLNEGSTFTVTLPLEVAAEIEKQPA